MSLFDDHTKDNPVTAQLLRDVIRSRKSYPNDSMEQICDKMLNILYKEVEYSVHEDVYEHFTSPQAFHLQSAFRKGFDAWKYRKESGPISKDILDPRFVEFVEFFQDRGFKVRISWDRYIDDSSADSKYIVIDWNER
jgi:hypothetical protein